MLLHFYIPMYHCAPCEDFDTWKCPNDNLCFFKYNEVCAPPPRNIQRCPNGGDFGNISCTEERCKELDSHFTKCPNSPYCNSPYTVDKMCPKDDDEEKNVFQTKCDLDEVTEEYFDRYHGGKYVYPRPGRNCTCPSMTNNITNCSSYCDQLKLTENEIEEYGPGISFSQCSDVCAPYCQEVKPTKDEIGVYDPNKTFTQCSDDCLSYCHQHHKQQFVQCEGANQCILRAQLCNGVQDCPNNTDELHCTQEFCRKNKKFKCPFENKCIEQKFAVDGDPYDHYDRSTSAFARNKCLFNNDEGNIFYVVQCHQKNNYICPKKTEHLSGIKDHCISLDHSCIAEKATNVTNYIENETGLHHSYLWQCTPNQQEYIFLANVCNYILDCQASGFNDESYLVCERLSFIRALAWSFSIVF